MFGKCRDADDGMNTKGRHASEIYSARTSWVPQESCAPRNRLLADDSVSRASRVTDIGEAPRIGRAARAVAAGSFDVPIDHHFLLDIRSGERNSRMGIVTDAVFPPPAWDTGSVCFDRSEMLLPGSFFRSRMERRRRAYTPPDPAGAPFDGVNMQSRREPH
jgi:hypothetical protein